MNFEQYKEKYFNLFYIFGAISFLVPLIVYLDTVSPTVSFWDCGEFIACSYTMGVPHPPGAPMYLLIGRLFTLLPIPGDIAFRVNIISVLCSVATVVLLYLTIVRLIKEWWSHKDITNSFIIYFSSCIGALSFTFTDTFWFNAVEAEVYALSMFLTALVLYLAILWMDNCKEYASVRFLLFSVYLFGLAVGVHLLNLLVIPSILVLIIFTDKEVLANINLWALVPLLVFLGISTYLVIYIRSGMDPMIDENNPENWENFQKYLNREQYGQESMFLTIFDRKAPFWEYQIKKMYLRYFGWNFIGEGTIAGIDRGAKELISFRGLYGLPFLLGMIGMLHHFRRDWKRAFSIMLLFIMTGIAITIYLNQPDPQPRERDYVYVGSFFAFAIWIGIGMQAIFELIKEVLSSASKLFKPALITAGGLILLLVPLNMARFNYDSQDRSGNYIPWDYSYNILQSCEKDAILFTNGDNDTFPLWYLQTVEGIRTDVKIVNLSLLNTDWYIMQLKHKMGVPVSLPDNRIKDITPILWEETKTVAIDVQKNDVEKFYYEYKEFQRRNLEPEKTKISIKLGPTFMGRFLRVQDYMILHILYENQWEYPVYFALTVPQNNQVNLSEYTRMEGLASKIVPFKNTMGSLERLRENLFEKFKFRNLDNPEVYYDVQSKSLLLNYRSAFLQLAYMYIVKGNKEEAGNVLDKMEEFLPQKVIPIEDFRMTLQIGKMFYQVGKNDKFREMLSYLLDKFEDMQKRIEVAQHYQYLLKDYEKAEQIYLDILSKNPDNPTPYSVLSQLYSATKEYKKGIELLERWLSLHPMDKNATDKLNEFKEKLAEQNKSKKEENE